MDFAAPLQRLIDEFRRLPGVGQKSAQRLAFHVLRSSREDASRLAEALIDVKDNLGICAECNNISDAELCPYCRDPHRDRSAICVIEESHNILPIETTRTFQVFESFNQLPFWTLLPVDDTVRVELLDLRFGSIQRPGFEAVAFVEPDHRIARTYFSFGVR